MSPYHSVSTGQWSVTVSFSRCFSGICLRSRWLQLPACCPDVSPEELCLRSEPPSGRLKLMCGRLLDTFNKTGSLYTSSWFKNIQLIRNFCSDTQSRSTSSSVKWLHIRSWSTKRRFHSKTERSSCGTFVNLLMNAPILRFFFQNDIPKLKAWQLPHSLRLRDVIGTFGEGTPSSCFLEV